MQRNLISHGRFYDEVFKIAMYSNGDTLENGVGYWFLIARENGPASGYNWCQ